MDQNLQILIATVIAVFLEAAPFLLLGSLISALFEVYLPEEKIVKYLPRHKLPGVAVGLFAGMLIPTCDCGVVSIVRRLLKKDVPVHVAVTYMFSAPVINPLVLAATYVAFQGNIWMVLGRAGMVAVCACGLGWAMSGIHPTQLIREKERFAFQHHEPSGDAAADGHPEIESGAGTMCGTGGSDGTRPPSGFIRVFLHTASEFMDMGKYVVLAGIIVGLLKGFLPQETLLLFQDNPLLAVGAMMLLAMLLSVCSEADAFVAAAFSTFPAVARLAFVAIGPMVDIKLVFMYGSVFKLPIVLVFIIVPTVLVYSLSVLLGLVVG